MKRRILLFILFSLFFYNNLFAQQYKFVYIQTENKQPFFVKINNVLYSSSASGYVVIPKLNEGTYQAIVGFPANEWPQQTISFNLKKDAGFLLKNSDKGWTLHNLQTQEISVANAQAIKVVDTSVDDDDPFTKTLSDVVNTPSLRKRTVTTTTAVEPEPVKKSEPVVITQVPKDTISTPVATAELPVSAEKLSTFKKLVNNETEKGRDLVYVDEITRDTIRVFIVAEQKMITTAAADKKPEEKKVQEKFIDIEIPAASPAINAPKDSSRSTPAPVTVSMVNSDCRSNADEDDFLKLRKKMAAAKNDDEMVSVAKKAFRSKCYSTAQLKNLSVLFLNDAGRYHFFDTSYPHVYDTGNFQTLQQQLSDPYFITRFQAMIRR